MTDSLLDTKGGPADWFINQLTRDIPGMNVAMQKGGQMPSAFEYFDGSFESGLDPNVRKYLEAMYELEQSRNYNPRDMSQAYANPQMLPTQDLSLGSLMGMAQSMGSGQRQGPGQGYIHPYIQSLMGG